MRHLTRILIISFLAVSMMAGNSMANIFGEDITQFDGNYSDTGGWYSDYEDEEVEPGAVATHAWDLEGFFLNDNKLTIVGGFDFINGNSDIYSGDVFLDKDGDVSYASNLVINDSAGDLIEGDGYKNITNAFGYDYVLDLDLRDQSILDDPNTFAYTIYQIDEAAVLRSGYYRQLDESSPYQYVSGGTAIGSGTFLYRDDLEDGGVDLTGGLHNALTVDISFLGPSTSFTAHFTQGCGNDNLIGYGTSAPVPEPATMVLFGIGLIGLGGFGVKRQSLNLASVYRGRIFLQGRASRYIVA